MTITRPSSILLITFGSRGDIQPLCLLGGELARAGHAVRVVANSDYERTIVGFGLTFVDVGLEFESLFKSPEFDRAFVERRRRPHRLIAAVLAQARLVSNGLPDILERCLAEIDRSDLVVYTVASSFAAVLAAERGIPSVQISYQPNVPTSRISAVNLSGRDFGRALNRASYEGMRGLSLLTWPAFRRFRQRTGRGRALRPWTLPVASSLRYSEQIHAYSPALAGEDLVAMQGAEAIGFFLREVDPAARLPEAVEAFLAAGPPPVYVGFGSMLWGAERNTRTVLQALALWGGRAIVSTGGGGLSRPAEIPPNVLVVGGIDHTLLFPRLAAAIHHGGAGTTAQALRCGLPCVILPVASDQLFWGRRVAALGAGEAPIPITKVTPDQLAQRIAKAATDGALHMSAEAIGARLRAEPGLKAAIACIEALLAKRTRDNTERL